MDIFVAILVAIVETIAAVSTVAHKNFQKNYWLMIGFFEHSVDPEDILYQVKFEFTWETSQNLPYIHEI